MEALLSRHDPHQHGHVPGHHPQKHHEFNERDGLLQNDHHASHHFSDNDYGQSIDFTIVDDLSELVVVLKNYDALFWIFHGKGKYPGADFSAVVKASTYLTKPVRDQGRIPKDEILSEGPVAWCVTHALGLSTGYMDKFLHFLGNKMIVSGLLLGVTASVYLESPDLGDDTYNTVLAALLGLGVFTLLFHVAGSIAFSSFISSPLVMSLTMLARIESQFYLYALDTIQMLAVLTFVAAMLLVAYSGSTVDFYLIASLVVPLGIIFLFILWSTWASSVVFKKQTVFSFYEKYCDRDGRLLPVYLRLVYKDSDNLDDEIAEALEKKDAAAKKTKSDG